MAEAWVGFVGVLLGAIVSTLVPFGVEMYKRRLERRETVQSQRANVTITLLKEAFEYDYTRRLGRDVPTLGMVHAITDWYALDIDKELRLLVQKLAFGLITAPPEVVKVILPNLRAILTEWLIGEASDADVIERLQATAVLAKRNGADLDN